MIDLHMNDDGCLELAGYSPDCTLEELLVGLAGVGDERSLCAGCGRCCSDVIPLVGWETARVLGGEGPETPAAGRGALAFPEPPDPARREKGVRGLMRDFRLPRAEAGLYYEYNTAEPIALRKNAAGRCPFRRDGSCASHATRPLVCRLYYCRQGPRLSGLRELIVARGIWHSYYVVGWLERKALGDNPFAAGRTYRDVLIGDFDVSFRGIAEQTAFQ
jgi:Fe-S-cluster containining protein